MADRRSIGFIGLGIMGRPMARHLIDAGHRVWLHTRSGVPPELTAAGGMACTTAAEVAQQAELIILMLPDTPDVEKVLFSDDGVTGALAQGRGQGRIVIDMSSISPVETRRFAARIRELGADYIDAPVSGGEVGAKDATLSIMCGGTEATFDKVRPVLALMGRNITRVGETGDGQTCKVANQIVVALTIRAVAEGLLFARKAGADPARVREALMGGLATSRILELHGERMIRRTFEPGFRIRLHQKDLNLALDAARQMGLALPATADAQQMFSAAVAMGGAEWDHSAMARAIEQLNGLGIGSEAD